jgi:hypothetical protein
MIVDIWHSLGYPKVLMNTNATISYQLNRTHGPSIEKEVTEGDGMRSAGWLSVTILILVITVLGVFYTGYEIIGAFGTLAMMAGVWQTFSHVEKENSQR